MFVFFFYVIDVEKRCFVFHFRNLFKEICLSQTCTKYILAERLMYSTRLNNSIWPRSEFWHWISSMRQKRNVKIYYRVFVNELFKKVPEGT